MFDSFNPMDSVPGSPVHGISQAGCLLWVPCIPPRADLPVSEESFPTTPSFTGWILYHPGVFSEAHGEKLMTQIGKKIL